MVRSLLLCACIALTVAVCAASGFTEDRQFTSFLDYVKAYDKKYDTLAEFHFRFIVFKETLERISKKNLEGSLATFGLNKYSDLTPEEFSEKMLMSKDVYKNQERTSPIEVESGPTQPFDWRDHKPSVVTPVKNQEQCGSCWAFSATENVESQVALAGHGLNVLAPQQFVDCVTADYGCGGGLPQDAFAYLEGITQQGGGQELETEYPYEAVTQSCMYNPSSKTPGHIVNHGFLPTNEDKMRSYCFENGPISIGVDAGDGGWQDYNGGILGPNDCGNNLDHAVIALGYGIEGNVPYWIVRNSWGTDWGIDGYIHLKFGTDTCGMAQSPTWASDKSQ